MIKYRRPALTSELFRAITTASPDDVWAALTATGSSLGYLYGMTAESDWQAGATLTLALDRWHLVGDILVADRPRRLCYALGDRPGEPSVYVTWELRPLDDATVIRLTVDEPWPLTEDTDDLEAAWLPVLSGLVTQLGAYRGTGSADALPSRQARRARFSSRPLVGAAPGVRPAVRAAAQPDRGGPGANRLRHRGTPLPGRAMDAADRPRPEDPSGALWIVSGLGAIAAGGTPTPVS